MPLPETKDAERGAWPPALWQPLQADLEEASVWYSGDEADLAKFYASASSDSPVLPSDPPLRRATRGLLGKAKFWSRQTNTSTSKASQQRIHVPAAADVAATAADLLFGEPPALVIPEAHGDEGEAQATAQATENRLNELMQLDGIPSTLLEAAEVCSAIGGVYLHPVWDRTVTDHPMLDVVHGDHAVPEFRFGHLTAVTFWRVVLEDGSGQVWRHLERHEVLNGEAVIYHGLYAGTRDMLGVRQPLTDHPDTALLEAASTDNEMVTMPGMAGKGLAVRYVPNVLPNRKHRGKPVGRSDLAGTFTLMDALDEVFTSWMRDVRLAKARIIAPSDFLTSRGRGLGGEFDMDAEVFAPLDMDPSTQEKAGITLAQFDIRTDDHYATAKALFERIVATAGYSPQTFGIDGGGGMHQVTATEVRAREGRSLRTTNRKQGYWRQAIEDVAEMLLIIDREVFGNTEVEPMRPRVDFGEPVSSDPHEVATVLQLLDSAKALSIETKVRMAQPDLDDSEVDAEVSRIMDEEGLAVPSPSGLPPNIGNGNQPPAPPAGGAPPEPAPVGGQ